MQQWELLANGQGEGVDGKLLRGTCLSIRVQRKELIGYQGWGDSRLAGLQDSLLKMGSAGQGRPSGQKRSKEPD